MTHPVRFIRLGTVLARFAILALALWPGFAAALDLTLATFTTRFSHSGPGLLLQHLQKGDEPQVEQDIAAILAMQADVVVLTNFDFDYDGLALAALQKRLADKGLVYADSLGLQPNTGIPTWLDLNHDGALSGPRDAQAYGRFAGQAGMAILSRYPLDRDHIRDFTALLWKDLPDANLPPDMTDDARLLQRLSTSGHYEVPVIYAKGKALRLLVWSATPPIFDGPEDRNGRRNADETSLWLHLLAGDLPQGPGVTYSPPASPFVLMGQPNTDPNDGDGRHDTLKALLSSPYVKDPLPKGNSGHVDKGQSGDPALDTALVGKSLIGLRLDVILPSKDITVKEAGVMWPASSDPFAATLEYASPHRPVWAKLTLP